MRSKCQPGAARADPLLRRVLGLDWRMLLDKIQNTPQMDESGPIELEGRDRRATGRRQADDLGEILAPRKMLTPTVLTGMIQRGEPIGGRIGRHRPDRLMRITPLAREGKVVRDGRTACLTRHNVLDRK